jgi:hypothetical protein
MKSFCFVILIVAGFFCTSCGPGPVTESKISGYYFSSPESSVILPAVLREVSGIVLTDPEIIACVQDENGIVFFYDLKERKITSQINFAANGDYEGIARIQDTLYVLQSDGLLIKIADFRNKNNVVSSFQTGIPSKDNEGICYDALNNRLLLACKESTGKGDLLKSKRYVFSFDPVKGRLDDEPVYSFDIGELKDFAVRKKIPLPMKGTKKGPPEPLLRFQPSAIGINPVTNKLYLLSADDFLLFIFNRDGVIEQIVRLNQGLFNQAEGITFHENGDMIISNEGMKKGPGSLRLLTFYPEP